MSQSNNRLIVVFNSQIRVRLSLVTFRCSVGVAKRKLRHSKCPIIGIIGSCDKLCGVVLILPDSFVVVANHKLRAIGNIGQIRGVGDPRPVSVVWD